MLGLLCLLSHPLKIADLSRSLFHTSPRSSSLLSINVPTFSQACPFLRAIPLVQSFSTSCTFFPLKMEIKLVSVS